MLEDGNIFKNQKELLLNPESFINIGSKAKSM